MFDPRLPYFNGRPLRLYQLQMSMGSNEFRTVRLFIMNFLIVWLRPRFIIIYDKRSQSSLRCGALNNPIGTGDRCAPNGQINGVMAEGLMRGTVNTFLE